MSEFWEKNIPKKLKTKAYDVYGRNECVLCASKTKTLLHHVWLENPYKDDEVNNPYENTEPEDLVPLCDSCHRKVERFGLRLRGSLMVKTLWWRVKQEKEEFEGELFDYLDEKANL